MHLYSLLSYLSFTFSRLSVQSIRVFLMLVSYYVSQSFSFQYYQLYFKTHSGKESYSRIILTIIGIGLLTLTSEFKIGNGDIFCILSALFYAIHVITGSVTKHEFHCTWSSATRLRRPI